MNLNKHNVLGVLRALAGTLVLASACNAIALERDSDEHALSTDKLEQPSAVASTGPTPTAVGPTPAVEQSPAQEQAGKSSPPTTQATEPATAPTMVKRPRVPTASSNALPKPDMKEKPVKLVFTQNLETDPGSIANAPITPASEPVAAPAVAAPPVPHIQPTRTETVVANPVVSLTPTLVVATVAGLFGGMMVLGGQSTLQFARRRRARAQAVNTPALNDLNEKPLTDTVLARVDATKPAEAELRSDDAAPCANVLPEVGVPLDDALRIALEWAKGEEPNAGLVAELNLPAHMGTAFGGRAGMVSVTGPVRSRNEDACMMLTLTDGRVLLMSADGMGGQADGHLASRLALLGACIGIRDALSGQPETPSEQLLGKGFSGARSLLQDATAVGRLDATAGTTLIATLIERTRYVTCYLGDGGAFVRRADGVFEPLMQPQKSSSTVLDCYLAANSPELWEPQSTVLARHRGDTLILGSDGVMDRVTITDVLDWLASSVASSGLSMQEALRQLVVHFAQLRTDDGRLIADDNMSMLAIRMPG